MRIRDNILAVCIIAMGCLSFLAIDYDFGNANGLNELPITDHGSLSGLGDQADHTWAVTIDGSREVNSLWFNTTSTPEHKEGQIHWVDDDKTMEIDTEVSETHIQVGQEIVIRCTNKTGSQLTNGQIVYINGAQGNKPTIALAKADAEATSHGYAGFVTQSSIDNNATGYVTKIGLVRDLDTSAYAAGTTLYLSADTAGAYTDTAPTAPNHAHTVGVVVTSNADNGVILADIQDGFEFRELHDVLFTNATTYQVLYYDETAGLWQNIDLANLPDFYNYTSAQSDVNAAQDISERSTWRVGNLYMPGSDNGIEPLTTYRNKLYVVEGGDDIRVPVFGGYTEAITYHSIYIGDDGGSGTVTNNKRVTFDSSSSITVPAGEVYYSDKVGKAVSRGNTLVITAATSGVVKGHSVDYQTYYETGNVAAQTAALANTYAYDANEGGYQVNGVTGFMVLKDGAAPVMNTLVIANSIGTSGGAGSSWPQRLGTHENVYNGAKSGDSISNISAKIPFLFRPGLEIDRILVNAISNDVIADDENTIKENIIDTICTIKARGVGAILCTIIPRSGLTAAQETTRQNLNAWMRTLPSGADGIIDFDVLIRDPADPSQILGAYSGDGVHPNSTGTQVMLNAIYAEPTSMINYQKNLYTPQTYYITKSSGNDYNDGSSSAHWKTLDNIPAYIPSVASNDLVFVLDGVFTNSTAVLDVSNRLLANSTVLIKGAVFTEYSGTATGSTLEYPQGSSRVDKLHDSGATFGTISTVWQLALDVNGDGDYDDDEDRRYIPALANTTTITIYGGFGKDNDSVEINPTGLKYAVRSYNAHLDAGTFISHGITLNNIRGVRIQDIDFVNFDNAANNQSAVYMNAAEGIVRGCLMRSGRIGVYAEHGSFLEQYGNHLLSNTIGTYYLAAGGSLYSNLPDTCAYGIFLAANATLLRCDENEIKDCTLSGARIDSAKIQGGILHLKITGTGASARSVNVLKDGMVGVLSGFYENSNSAYGILCETGGKIFATKDGTTKNEVTGHSTAGRFGVYVAPPGYFSGFSNTTSWGNDTNWGEGSIDWTE